MKKNYYLVLDTETANMVEEPLAYDVGFAICDKKGNIYEKFSFIVSEIFFDERKILGNSQLMGTSYYKEKLPQYYDGMKSGKWQVASIWTIRRKIHSLMKEYDIKKVFAYNMNFDKNALNYTLRYTSKSFKRWFFPYGTEFCCIWNMACQVIMQQNTFLRIARQIGRAHV